MILYKDSCIVTPPKTGSTSLHERLCRGDTGLYVIGPQCGNYFAEKHTTFLPWEVLIRKEVVIKLLVRDAASRFVSLYKHFCRYEREVTLDEYGLLVEHKVCSGFYWWTYSMYHASLVSQLSRENVSREIEATTIERLKVSGLGCFNVSPGPHITPPDHVMIHEDESFIREHLS